jgi:murein DD-endopeptidase MepM/ murein hydrolase activator NlpD
VLNCVAKSNGLRHGNVKVIICRSRHLKPTISVARKHLIAALLALPFAGIMAAFGIAPATAPEPPVAIRTVTTPISIERDPEPTFEEAVARLHVPADQVAQPVVSLDTVRAGDTLSELLNRLGVQIEEILGFVRDDPRAHELLRLPVGRVFMARTDPSGSLISLRVRRDGESALEIRRGKNGLYSILLAADVSRQVQMRSGVVHSSLFGATDTAGVPDAITAQLVKIFSSDIDFHTDLRSGDRFSVVYEQYYDGAEAIKAGRLLAAEFTNQGRAYRAVYFEQQTGVGDYFTPEGENLRKAFLRSPVEFSRVTSGFSMSRLHPIHNTWRAHKGVDLAAPEGTPIVAVADGVVTLAGRHGGYGNAVELRHDQQYGTLYGHLSRIRDGVRQGAKVTQGDVIGYVGSTGWATGPHLHYEFRISGVHHDPLGVALPQAFPVPDRHRVRFAVETAPLVQNLVLAQNAGQIARFE